MSKRKTHAEVRAEGYHAAIQHAVEALWSEYGDAEMICTLLRETHFGEEDLALLPEADRAEILAAWA